MLPLISVIIPIYNVELYVRRAINSVRMQTYTNIEIILVDDGSTDSCGQICDEYEKADTRVRVIHKQNGGLSDARNAGIEVAKGSYFAFLDSDDFYAPIFLEVLYETLLKTEADISVCAFEMEEDAKAVLEAFFEAEKERYCRGDVKLNVYDTREALLMQYETVCEQATDFIVAWNKLYKASLFEKIRYPKGRIHEDEATTYKLFDLAGKVAYIDLRLYGYFTMPQSITRKRFTKKRLHWIDALDERIAYFRDKGDKALLRQAIRARADGAIRYYSLLLQSESDIETEKKRLRACVRAALFFRDEGKKQDRLLGIRTKIGYLLFLISPSLHKWLVGY